MADTEGDEYICPACSAPVEPDWQACPSCGAEFAPPEADAGATDGDSGTGLEELEAEILGATSAQAAGPDPISELEAEINEAVAAAIPDAPPSEEAKAPPARRKPGLLGRLGGLLGTVGLGLLLAGAVGVLVAANYDTWIRGQSASSVGSLQQIGILGAAGLLAVGVVLMLVGGGKLKRKGARAG